MTFALPYIVVKNRVPCHFYATLYCQKLSAMSLLRHPILLSKIECHVTFAPPYIVVKIECHITFAPPYIVVKIECHVTFAPSHIVKNRGPCHFCATLYCQKSSAMSLLRHPILSKIEGHVTFAPPYVVVKNRVPCHFCSTLYCC